jgi:monoamine oxidase
MQQDVIIIGAGVAGLVVLNELSRAGLKCTVLEAAPVAGGRIATLYDGGFPGPVETGAEFLHGDDVPFTNKLLKDAGLEVVQAAGAMIPVRKGIWFDENERDEQFGVFMQQLNELETDKPMQAFLDENFPAGEYDSLRAMVRRFAEGFDLADLNNASAFALREEWQHDTTQQYRVKEGYTGMIHHLLNSYDKSTSSVHYSSNVYKVEYANGNAHVYTRDNNEYHARKVVIAAPAAVLQSGNIELSPLPPEYQNAIRQLAVGSVIKILFLFKTPFWEEKGNDIGFILSDEPIPTWWTQLPDKTPLLTGWLGGPDATTKSNLPGDELYELALKSVANIFGKDVSYVRTQLVHHKIVCWNTQPFALGGYSYNTVESKAAKEILSNAIEGSIYFTGEAISTGGSQGTVEAAIESAMRVAAAVRNSLIK